MRLKKLRSTERKINTALKKNSKSVISLCNLIILALSSHITPLHSPSYTVICCSKLYSHSVTSVLCLNYKTLKTSYISICSNLKFVKDLISISYITQFTYIMGRKVNQQVQKFVHGFKNVYLAQHTAVLKYANKDVVQSSS